MNKITKKQNKFVNCIINNDLKNLKQFINNPTINPNENYHWAIRYACKLNYIEIIKLLLKDERINPAANSNASIHFSFKDNNLEVVNLLWQ